MISTGPTLGKKEKEIETRYDRIAPIYDLVDWFIPKAWRVMATRLLHGKVLEAGVGTGLNLPYYPKSCSGFYGIDLSPKMLDRAKRRPNSIKPPIQFSIMDVQRLDFSNNQFDSVLATFLFCSVPDPIRGLSECARVLKPGGQLILLEHVGSAKPGVRKLMERLNPLTVKFMGDHITRNPLQDVVTTGLRVQSVTNLFSDVVQLIVCRK